MSDKQVGTTFGLTDIIKSFEDRLAELKWERDEAQRAGMQFREKWLSSEKKFAERPFRDIKELTTEEFVKELNRRLDYYRTRDMDDD